MEQKINAVKTASKIISIIAKIGYTVMTVVMCISAAMLIFLGVTGGKTSMITIGKTNIVFFDRLATTPAELAAISAVLIVMGGIIFTISLFAYRMFHEISLTGEPFVEKYVKTVRVIGILTAVLPCASGLSESIASIILRTTMPEILNDIPGVVIGAIVFCLSYIVDYGCGISKKLAADSKENTEK